MRLEINGEVLEIDSKQIAQTFQRNDLADIKTRQLSFSNSIKVPRTPHNERVFRHLGILTSSSNIAQKKNKTTLIIDGVKILVNGYSVIKSYNEQYYTIVILGENSLLYEALGAKKLNQLNYSDINYYPNISEAQNLTESTTGKVFAIANYGAGDVFEYMPCSVYVSTIWDKIFKEAGYLYRGAIFESKDFKELVVPPTKGYIPENTEGLLIGIKTIESLPIDIYYKFNNFTDPITNNNTDNTVKFTTSNNGEVWTIDDSIIFKAKQRVSIRVESLNYNTDRAKCYLRVQLNESTISYVNLEETKTLILAVNADDKITCHVRVSPDYSDYEDSLNDQIPIYPPITITDIQFRFVIDKIEGGYLINYNEIMPEISQKDFIKDIMQKFGLVQYSNRHQPKELFFIKLEDTLNDRTGAEDWSNKYVSHQTATSIGNYGQRNLLKYKYSDETENYADGCIDIDNKTLASEKTLLTSIFTANKQIGSIDGGRHKISLWEKTDKGELKTRKSSASIYKIVRRDNDIYISSSTSLNSVSINNVSYLDFTPCHYNNYIQENYKAFTNMLQVSQKVTAYIKLTPYDIANIKFEKLKYIEQLGKYFYLNKVVGYKGNNTTKVELIAVGDMVFNSPPVMIGNTTISIKQSGSYTMEWADFISEAIDPENDDIIEIKITSLPENISMKYKGKEVNGSIAIKKVDVSELKLYSQSSDSGYQSQFQFKLKDAGSGYFSQAQGIINIEVSAREKVPPIVSAGGDVQFLKWNDPNISEGVTRLTGVATDDIGISSVLWEKVEGDYIQMIDADKPALLLVTENKIGTWKFRFTAIDTDGLQGSDEMYLRMYDKYTSIKKNENLIEINGEFNATVTLRVKAVGCHAILGGENVSNGETKDIEITLTGSSKILLPMISYTENYGSLNVNLVSVNKGMIRTGNVVIFSKSFEGGREIITNP